MWTQIKRREFAINQGGSMSKRKSEGNTEQDEGNTDGQTVILVEIEDMHRSDVIALDKRFGARVDSIKSATKELEAMRYGRFCPASSLAALEGIERAVGAAKGLLVRTA